MVLPSLEKLLVMAFVLDAAEVASFAKLCPAEVVDLFTLAIVLVTTASILLKSENSSFILSPAMLIPKSAMR